MENLFFLPWRHHCEYYIILYMQWMSLLKVENHIFQLADCEMEDLSTCFADGERKVDFVLVHQTRSSWEA